MIEVVMLYDGNDVLALCHDLKTIVPDLTIARAKELLISFGTIVVDQKQYDAILRLTKLYSPHFDVGKTVKH